MDHPSSCTALALGGAFTVERAAELQSLLVAQLPAAQSLCLGAISDIDCAGLQLLLAAKRDNPELALHNASHAVQTLFEQLNLSHLLSA